MKNLLTRLGIDNKYFSSLNASWKEGIGSSVMTTVTDYYFIPFGLLIGASAKEIGFLVAIPHIVSALFQLITVQLTKLIGSRKKIIWIGSYIHGSLILPIAILALVSIPYRVELFIFFVTLFRTIGQIIGTIWGSLVSDYLKPQERGKYIGWRNRVIGIAGIAGLALGGFLLFLVKKFGLPEYAFFILFILTATARFFSGFFMGKMEDLPVHHRVSEEFTFLQFISRFKESNFVKFVFYIFCFSFATHLAAPFFSVFMIKDLHFNYLEYMSVHLSAIIGGLIAFPIWGRHADFVGNAKVLKSTSLLIPFIPLLWIFTQKVYFLILIEIFAGFVWGGFNLCSANYIYDAVTTQKRIRCLSYFNLIVSIGIFLGAGTGGLLAKMLPNLNGHRLYSLFLLSAILRFLCFFFLSGHFREVRTAFRRTSNKELFFSVLGIRPMLEQSREYPAITFDSVSRKKSV